MPKITYHAEATTPTALRDEIVADLRRQAAEHFAAAEKTKRARVADENRARAEALTERAAFWAAVVVTE